MCSEHQKHTQMGENVLAGQAPGCNLGLDCVGRWQRTTGLWQDGCLVPSCRYIGLSNKDQVQHAAWRELCPGPTPSPEEVVGQQCMERRAALWVRLQESIMQGLL